MMTPKMNMDADTAFDSLALVHHSLYSQPLTPDMRFQSFQQNVRGDFEKNIRHKKDAQRSTDLIAFDLELLW